MAVKSMTGFARVEGQHVRCTWTWEIKSVNAKGLDIRCRLASGFEDLDNEVRKQVSSVVKRGNITANLNLEWQTADSAFQINTKVLDLILDTIPEIENRLSQPAPVSAAGVLSLRGVIEVSEQNVSDSERAEIKAQVLRDMKAAVVALDEMRIQEGARLLPVLDGQVRDIADLTAKAVSNPSVTPGAIRARLQAQIDEILGGETELPQERLMQEVAVLVTKADIREELDRLKAHEAAASEFLKTGGPIGRKLDFLCQEFNREANTLCSKSSDVDLTQIGLDMKTHIERFREQIQNIE